MNILITGGAGFIGSHLADFLLDQGHYVLIIDNLSTGKNERLHRHRSCVLDISKEDNLLKLSSLIDSHQIELVYHLAALPNVEQSLKQTSLTHRHTLTSTVILLEACKNTKVKKIVFSSTSAIYGNCEILPTNERCEPNPLTPYALQKLLSEQYIKLYTELYDIKCICLRYFNVFGDRMTNTGAYKSVLSIFKEQKEIGLPLTITNDGEQRRDFIHVNDVVNANYLVGINDINKKFDIFNVGYGKNFSVNEIANEFKCETIFIGNRVESKISLCDFSKIKKEFGWQPTKNVLEWVKDYVENK